VSGRERYPGCHPERSEGSLRPVGGSPRCVRAGPAVILSAAKDLFARRARPFAEFPLSEAHGLRATGCDCSNCQRLCFTLNLALIVICDGVVFQRVICGKAARNQQKRKHEGDIFNVRSRTGVQSNCFIHHPLLYKPPIRRETMYVAYDLQTGHVYRKAVVQ
jgi:hypothetical protein